MAIENFWKHLITSKPDNITFENASIDVVLKDCYVNYDTTACVRNSLLTSLGFLTFLLCFTRIVKLHTNHHPQIHQYLIFYSAGLEVMCLIIKWAAFVSLFQMEFAACFLKMIQFVLLCHYHWSQASRILHNQILIRWLIMPLLIGFLCFCTGITIMALMSEFSPWIECLAPHWILLSVSEFLCIQLYTIAGVYITRKINSMVAEDSLKWEQKRDLWSVIGTYQFSAIASLLYYTVLQAYGDQKIGCSGVFDHVQEIYSPVYASFMVIKYLGPIWIMFLIFYPTRGYLSSEDERLLGLSFDGSLTSTFNPEGRFEDEYRPLLFPVPGSATSGPEEQSILRRSTSSPALLSSCSPLCPTLQAPQYSAYAPVVDYGTMDPWNAQNNALVHQPPKRSRHDSGMPSRNLKERKVKIVSLNQCSEEIENITPSSGERA